MSSPRLVHFMALGLVALAGTSAAAPVNVTTKASTENYSLELDVGPTEHMYSAAEAQAKHLTEGEIMVGGQMTMAMGAGWLHVELHVLSRKTGAPVTGADVVIAVMNLQTKAKSSVPVAVMYGIQAGEADWHYGNNVKMAPGSYAVDVTANGESARFDVTIPEG